MPTYHVIRSSIGASRIQKQTYVELTDGVPLTLVILDSMTCSLPHGPVQQRVPVRDGNGFFKRFKHL